MVIPARDAGRSLAHCLSAVYRSSFQDFEVIVVDDHSSDDSARIAGGFPCKVIRLEKNRGVAGARNAGAGQAGGELLMFLDSDIIVEKDTIEKIVAVFRRDPSAKCVGGIASKTSRAQGFGPAFVALHDWYYVHSWGEDERYREVSCFPSDCGAVYKDLFADAGGFDEGFSGAGVEDYDLGARLSGRHPIRRYKDILVHHYTAGVLLRSYKLFKRCFPYVPYLLRRGSLEKNDSIINTGEIASTILVLLAAALGAAAELFPGAIYLGLLALLAVSVINAGFFVFIAREAGPVFLLRSIPSLYLIYLAVAAGMVAASLAHCARATWGRSRRSRSGRRARAPDRLGRQAP